MVPVVVSEVRLTTWSRNARRNPASGSSRTESHRSGGRLVF
jgi:hypothetical protein